MKNFEKTQPFYQAFIFDMDGTIVSTVEDICDAVNYSLRLHKLDEISYEECTSYLGNGSVKLIQRAMHFLHQEIFQEVFDDYYQYYLKHDVVKTKPYDGLLENLIKAKKRGIKLFIYTNKPEKIALEIVKHAFPDNLFDMMVGIPLGGKTKPDKEAFVTAVKDYHLDYSRCAYFGDSTTDLETAKNLQVKTTVTVLWGYDKEDKLKSYPIQPDVYLLSPVEIESFVEMSI